VLVPAEALVALAEAAGAQAVASFGQALGEAMGRRVSVRLGAGRQGVEQRQQAVRSAPFERVVDHLAGEVALAGLGALGAERWGRALVLLLEHCPLSAGGENLLEHVLAAAITAATGTKASLVVLDREEARLRLLLVGAEVGPAVRARLERGEGWATLLATIQRGVATA
jgi:hypothetical protein